VSDVYRSAGVGWACPKCGAVYAPFVPECRRCAPYTSSAQSSEWPQRPAPGTTGCPLSEPTLVTCSSDDPAKFGDERWKQ